MNYMKMNQITISEVVDQLRRLEVSKKYIIYTLLVEDIMSEPKLLERRKMVNSPDFLKNLLNMKKEEAIENMAAVLPLLRGADAKNLILKIVPVLLSYASLYDTRIYCIFEIMEVIRILPDFRKDQSLFDQWFYVFEKRKKHPKRKFAYKDEFYVQDLPCLQGDLDGNFSKCIGYSDVAFLRTVHRWLRILRLHKYLYFFANLTHEDILAIDSSNIKCCEAKVGVFDMTVGARKKILREIEELRCRPEVLKNIIKGRFDNLETAARDIKKILRTPISATAEASHNLPNLLVKALRKVCEEVIALVGTSEEIIPLYGLIISIMKEAYNYSYFDVVQKEYFNAWRLQLSSKINNPISKSIIAPVTIRVPKTSDEEWKLLEWDGSMSSIEKSTAIIAEEMTNFVLS